MSASPGSPYSGGEPYEPSDLPPVAGMPATGPAPPVGVPDMAGTPGVAEQPLYDDEFAAPPAGMTGAAPGGAPAGHTGAYASAPDGTRTGDDLPGEPLSSVGDLISDIAQDLSTLVRQETELAKAELRQSATRAGKGAGMLGGAGVAGYFVLLFLSVALWWLIGSWVGLGWSALIVAVIWAIIAAVLASMGRTELKRVQGVPRTVETAKQIPDAMKGNEDPR